METAGVGSVHACFAMEGSFLMDEMHACFQSRGWNLFGRGEPGRGRERRGSAVERVEDGGGGARRVGGARHRPRGVNEHRSMVLTLRF